MSVAKSQLVIVIGHIMAVDLLLQRGFLAAYPQEAIHVLLQGTAVWSLYLAIADMLVFGLLFAMFRHPEDRWMVAFAGNRWLPRYLLICWLTVALYSISFAIPGAYADGVFYGNWLANLACLCHNLSLLYGCVAAGSITGQVMRSAAGPLPVARRVRLCRAVWLVCFIASRTLTIPRYAAAFA